MHTGKQYQARVIAMLLRLACYNGNNYYLPVWIRLSKMGDTYVGSITAASRDAETYRDRIVEMFVNKTREFLPDIFKLSQGNPVYLEAYTSDSPIVMLLLLDERLAKSLRS